jgi:hypothetical protein
MSISLALESFGLTGLAKSKKAAFKTAKAGVHVSSARLWLAGGLITANAVLLLSYVYGVNDFTSTGYEIKTLQAKLNNFDEANKKLNLKISEANSMVSIQTDFLNANFVAAGANKYLTIDPNANYLTQR